MMKHTQTSSTTRPLTVLTKYNPSAGTLCEIARVTSKIDHTYLRHWSTLWGRALGVAFFMNAKLNQRKPLQLYENCLNHPELSKIAFNYFYKIFAESKPLAAEAMYRWLQGQTLNKIASLIGKSLTQVSRYIGEAKQRMTSQFKEILEDFVLKGKTLDDARAELKGRRQLETELTLCCSRPFNSIRIAKKVLDNCHIDVKENADEASLCALAGYLFNYSRLPIALSARLVYEGFASEYIYKLELQNGLREELSCIPDYKSRKKSFYLGIRKKFPTIYEELDQRFPNILCEPDQLSTSYKTVPDKEVNSASTTSVWSRFLR